MKTLNNKIGETFCEDLDWMCNTYKPIDTERPVRTCDSDTAETAFQKCSKEKVFWKYAANLQDSTHVEVRF